MREQVSPGEWNETSIDDGTGEPGEWNETSIDDGTGE